MWNLLSLASLIASSRPRPTLLTRWQNKTLLCTQALAAAMDTTSPWHAAYPAPRNSKPNGVLPSQVLELLKRPADSGPGGNFVLVDLRRTDHEGGTIRGSINLPAQSIYHTIPKLYTIFHAAGVETVIWYCASSQGRGTRAAGWFSDYIQDRHDDKIKSVVLLGGIKGWVAAGEEYKDYMDEYDSAKWGKKEI